MKISCCYLYVISKYGYPPKKEDEFNALKEIANLGFNTIELEGVREDHLKQVAKDKPEYKTTCSDLGLKVINFCPILPDIMNLDKEKRKKALDLFDLGIEIALFHGCSTVQLDSFSPPIEFIGEAPYKEMIKFGRQFKVKISPDFKWSELWEVIVSSVAKCNEKAKKAGLKLLMEPRVGELVSNTDAMLRLMDAVNDTNFQAVFDTGHQNAQKEILPFSVEKLGNRIGYLHVSDNDGKTNAHLGLGKGTIDWDGVFTALKKHKFDGYVAIDIGDVPNIDQEYTDSKIFLDKLSQRLGI